VEAALFENNYMGAVPPILAVFEMAPEREVLRLGTARSRGTRFTLRQVINHFLRFEASYIRGVAPGLARDMHYEGSGQILMSNYTRMGIFHGFSAQLNAQIPHSGTMITALVRFVPKQNPLVPLDPLSNLYEVGNEGVNLFVRQVVPVPQGFLTFLGLDFLAPEKVEALLDFRNLMNANVGHFESAGGSVALINSPRAVRGGVSLKF